MSDAVLVHRTPDHSLWRKCGGNMLQLVNAKTAVALRAWTLEGMSSAEKATMVEQAVAWMNGADLPLPPDELNRLRDEHHG